VRSAAGTAAVRIARAPGADRSAAAHRRGPTAVPTPVASIGAWAERATDDTLPRDERLLALHQLALRDRAAAEPILGDLLDDQDPYVRAKAKALLDRSAQPDLRAATPPGARPAAAGAPDSPAAPTSTNPGYAVDGDAR